MHLADPLLSEVPVATERKTLLSVYTVMLRLCLAGIYETWLFCGNGLNRLSHCPVQSVLPRGI